MITGIHAIMYANDAEATRKFFAETLGLSSVDAGGGWPIFALPPAELGVHPTDEAGGKHEIYLLCDDLHKTIDDLKKKGVEFTGPVREQEWGSLTTLVVPGGGNLHLYQPKHPTALGLER
ncbi:MAG TPA: VOC family protein [Polyangiaceae bacterium]